MNRAFRLASLVLLSAAAAPPDASAQIQTGPPLPWPVLYVRWPSFPDSPFDEVLEFQAGTNLILRQPNGTETNLTSLVAGAAKDPEISFDAAKVIFAAKLNAADQWHVYEMPIAGGPMTPLTSGPWNDTEPHYLPGGLGFVFLSNRAGEYGEDTSLSVDTTPSDPSDPQNSALWMAGALGQNPKRLSQNLSSDQRPIVLKDGRIVWSRWERAEERPSSRFPLFFLELDGGIDFGDHQGIDELFGNHIAFGGFDDPREMPNGLLVATKHYFHNVYRAGTLILIDPAAPPSPPPDFDQVYQFLSPSIGGGDGAEPDGRYRAPRPLPDGRILASWSPGPVFQNQLPLPDFGLYVVDPNVFDPQGNAVRTLFANDPSVDEIEAIPVVPYATLYGQPEPDVIPPWTSGATTGYIGCADAGVGNYDFVNGGGVSKMHGSFLPSDVTRFRFLKGVPIRLTDPDFTNTAGRQRGRTSYEASEVMGEIQLYSDRSFKIEIPADTPFTFQSLDSDGIALVNGTNWRQVFAGKGTTCTGCHARYTPGPPFASSIAAMQPPTPIGLNGPGIRVEYLRDVQPIFDAKCIQCHGTTAATTGAGLDLRDLPGLYFPVSSGGPGIWNRSYERLMQTDHGGVEVPPTQMTVNGQSIGPLSQDAVFFSKFVANGRARQSLLVWKLHGQRLDGLTNASSPSDVDYSGAPMPPPNSGVPALTQAEKDTLELWVDLGAGWSAGTGQNQTPDVALLVGAVAHFGGTVPLTFRSRQDPGAAYVAAASFGTVPGFDLYGTHVPLNPDVLFDVSLLPGTGVFNGFLGSLGAGGVSTAPSLSIPASASLVGLNFFVAFATLAANGLPLHVSAASPVQIVP
ncbi:MAG TPA: hypothetical protein VFI25_08240 [Planctomycetota bacterium]|nr:hypothetical protein [Planctomycetota bacterium]